MKKRFERIYVEITNVCNLNCSFCPKTKRAARFMSATEFEHICKSAEGYADVMFLHVMGEPLLHPELEDILNIVQKYGFFVCITTNGTLLTEKKNIILSHRDIIRKVSVSLHSAEANGECGANNGYLDSIIEFSKQAAEKDIITVMRLWNLDSDEGKGANSENDKIVSMLRESFCEEWRPRRDGFCMSKYIFLEYAGLFTWPSESEADAIENGYCHGLTDQIAILAGGEVVPCCLDCNADIKFGNIFENTLESIINSKRAKEMETALRCRRFTEELCRKCTYARRF